MTDKELSQRAKEYFAQIRKTDRLIQRLTDTVNTLRSGLTSQSYELKPDKVQTSGPKDTLGETITKIISLEEDINTRIDELVEQKADATLPQLRVILESLCGAGNYSADVADYTLLVKVGVAAKKNFQDVQTLLKRVAPVNLVLVVQQLFNIHQVLGGFTHAQLAWYTHSEVRTEELQTHECTPHKTLRPFTHAQLGGLENKSIRKEMTDGTVHT